MWIIRKLISPFIWLKTAFVFLLSYKIITRSILVFVPVSIIINLLGCESNSSSNTSSLLITSTLAASSLTPNGSIQIDATNVSDQRILHSELFGINSKWLDNGSGIIEYGEMIRDRSFRNHSNAALNRWLEFPEKRINGVITYVPEGDMHDGTWANKSYSGHMNLSQDEQGYTCLTQQVLGDSKAGASYKLHVSARKKSGTPALSVFFADNGFLPIEEVDNIKLISTESWNDYSFILEPTEDISPGMLRICNVSPGSVDVDEIRLNKQGGVPSVNALADIKIKELGVKSIRWPVGTDADRFLWKESIGPLKNRGENIGTFGRFQTTSWGLHEFLDYAEINSIVPLITVNILDDPANSADLVEYILGSTNTSMGKLRQENGRTEPWDVVNFELGNEPTELYQSGYTFDETSLGYIELSISTAQAMREKANSLGVNIKLQGTLDATFAAADWISAVPMLADWNNNVLNPTNGLLPLLDNIKGNFYSSFTSPFGAENLYDEIMAGGSTITQIVNNFNQALDTPLPFWLTEYSVLVQKSSQEIVVDRVKDFQAGLSVADILMTAVINNFGGAYLFNLAEEGTWGVLANNTDFRMRPSGLAFSMLTPMAGERILPVSTEGANKIEINGGKGNNPSNIEYDGFTAIATASDNRIQLFVLNRNYDDDKDLLINFDGFTGNTGDIYHLSSQKLNDNNEKNADEVAIRHEIFPMGSNVIRFPARSLTRIVIPGTFQ